MNYAALYNSPTIARCREYSLVLEAMHIGNHIAEKEHRYYLLVGEPDVQRAYEQLKFYVAENKQVEVLAKPLRPFSEGYLGALVFSGVMLLVALLEAVAPAGVNWQALGMAHSEKIVAGEWWRTITALTLHADTAHLLGNIGLGSLFGLMVSQYIGRGAAWFSIVMAGAIGNTLNALFYQTLHLSIGASTMVFAALGLLGIFALNAQHSYLQKGIRRWIPLFATVALLGFLGTAGERTDLMAHLLGYASGCAVGLAWMLVLKRTDADVPHQTTFAVLSLALVALAWGLALRS